MLPKVSGEHHELPVAQQKNAAAAIGLLRVLLGVALVLPLILFGIASWWNYDAALATAEQDLERTAEVAREQALKVFDSQNQLIDQVNDLINGLDGRDIDNVELPLHVALERMIARLPHVDGIMLASATGQPLVSGSVYPVPRGINLRGREYFEAVLQGHKGPYISTVRVGALNHRQFFGLARPWLGPSGTLRGVVDVAVSPSFFRDFYRALVREGAPGSEDKSISLMRDDGRILVRYPLFADPPPAGIPSLAFLAAIKQSAAEGIYTSHSVADPSGPLRLFDYRKIQGYPVYVVAARSREAVITKWRRTMAGQLVFGMPLAMALIGVTWTALVRTKREERALEHARQEIARRIRAEDILLRAQRLEAVGQMTGGIAHDFNNLLTIILGNTEMIERRMSENALVLRLTAAIRLASIRGAEITQRLLAFSGRQIIKPETIDANARLRDFKSLLQRAANATIQIDLDLDILPCPVRIDPGQFEAAILNLVGNARDSMPAGGHIVIATRNIAIATADYLDLAPGQYISVTVSDNGEGMDPETAAKAFDPFFTTKEVGKGTGLGLSQVYGFVRQAGGCARIISAPNEGTTVELIMARSGEKPAIEQLLDKDVRIRPATEGEVILIVEDEPCVLEAGVQNLRDLGYKTIAVPDAHSALEKLGTAERVDILFSDIVMPGGMDGFQLSVAARDLRPGIKVLLTSGYARTGMAVDLPKDVPLLTKPYDRAQLAKHLQLVMSNRT